MRDPEQRRERCCSAALRALSFAGDFLSRRVEALQVLYWGLDVLLAGVSEQG